MPTGISVLDRVEQAIRASKGPGLLVGLQKLDTLFIVGAIESDGKELAKVQDLLPRPYAIAGVFGDGKLSEGKMPGAVAAYVSGDGSSVRWVALTPSGQEGAELGDVEVLHGDGWREEWVTLRVLGSATLTYAAGSETTREVVEAVGQIGARCAGPEALFVLEGGAESLTDAARVGDLAPECGGGAPVVLRACPLLSTPKDAEAVEAILPEKGLHEGPTKTVGIELDALCLVPREFQGLWAAQQVVRPALMDQLARVLVVLEEEARWGELAAIRACHFAPSVLGFPVTMVVPLPEEGATGRAEARLAPRRVAAHALLGLPSDRPLLKLASALSLTGDGPTRTATPDDGKLRDVHLSLGSASKIKGGTQHVVRGSYTYHHYMQDGFNDAGWGCAYRSLQTLWSWFVAQGYTSLPPPSHGDIQTTLVKLGDKDLSFRGSKQWIGALELSYVLEECLGVECRVLPLKSGADVASKARELAHHFDTQGTPVMVGGGVLAYTMLGVDWNEDTGDVAFLILDPHYTGADDLAKIKAGQWVAWKRYGDNAAAGGKLLRDEAFYNLLLPQRPRGV